MLEDALGYPTRDDGWLKTVLIGGALSLFGFLLLPAIVVQGYYLRTMAGRAADEPPTFTDWGGLLADGLKSIVVIIAYGVVPVLVGVVLPAVVGTFVLGMGSAAGADGGALGGAFALVAVLVFVPLLFVAVFAAVYLGPAALALMAREGDLGAAFDWGQLRAATFTKTYLVGWLFAALVLLVGGSIAAVLTFLLVGIFLSFYVNVVAYRIIGVTVEDSLEAREPSA